MLCGARVLHAMPSPLPLLRSHVLLALALMLTMLAVLLALALMLTMLAVLLALALMLTMLAVLLRPCHRTIHKLYAAHTRHTTPAAGAPRCPSAARAPAPAPPHHPLQPTRPAPAPPHQQPMPAAPPPTKCVAGTSTPMPATALQAAPARQCSTGDPASWMQCQSPIRASCATAPPPSSPCAQWAASRSTMPAWRCATAWRCFRRGLAATRGPRQWPAPVLWAWRQCRCAAEMARRTTAPVLLGARAWLWHTMGSAGLAWVQLRWPCAAARRTTCRCAALEE
jgi:hypothetical protein